MIPTLSQVATLWIASTPDGFGGHNFNDPVTVKCRWEEKSELIPGSTEISRAVVYLSEDASPEDYILLGASDNADPISVGASKVIHFQKIPDLRSLNALRRVWL